VLEPAALDPPTRALVGRLQSAMAARDDALMRAVVDLFEEQGFQVCGAHEVMPDLVVEPGLALGPSVSDAARADMAEAQRILAALAPLDLGQSAVVELGQCLGVETLQGTDALLGFVAATPARLRRGRGVLVKMPKAGQEMRVDMPVIGPDSVAQAARAGLAGIAVAAGGVMVLERDRVADLARQHGLFVVAL